MHKENKFNKKPLSHLELWNFVENFGDMSSKNNSCDIDYSDILDPMFYSSFESESDITKKKSN